ncbi:unnamed protein product [Nesidiocoris tenuis]|uniref:ubiquitinyl hydrolase 1 n=2 Tax=Nesidiocoris tenuis TaxID=355587 RepID=A0A6H5HLM2_9HEMI|nr:ubiquitin specific peptidase [Nesidiocoris tenuis]CAB0019031.1 unnamed protein product [Nesidiocoris tenuis]
MEKDDEPSIEEQKEFVQTQLSRPMVSGETWYLVDAKWMKLLGGYLGLGGSNSRFLATNPGTIDNTRLLNEDGGLNLGLEEGVDYELVHEQLWTQLVEWYGTYPDQPPIERRTVQISPNYVIVEVYPVKIRASPNFSMCPHVMLTFSRTTRVKSVEAEIRRKFSVKVDSRLWLITPGATPEVLDSNKTLSDYGVVGENNDFVLETEGEFQDWRDRDGVSGDKKFASDDNDLSSDSNKMSTETPHIPGVCGLSNLRNTCFMNAVLQCMSNCPPVTEYFLAQRHLKELNRYNPLGMRGEMALAFGALIGTMWSGNHPFTSPIHFKVQLGRFNPVFSGCQQHDSQELLTFLLDGLHEDLNRIKQKPYTQVNDDSDREDKVLAREAWERHRKRNDSIIVDTFHGLLKSRVVCPDCKKVSVTFDPFCNLSLPLPQKKDRVITITLVPSDSQRPILKLKLDVPRQGIVSDLYNHKIVKLSERTSASRSYLVVEMSRNHIHKCYSDDDNLDNIHDQDNIFVFELPTGGANMTRDRPMMLPVYFWEVNENSERFDNNQLFGIPFFFVLPNEKISESELRTKLLEPIEQRFTVRLLPKDNSSQDPDQIDRAMKDSWFLIYSKDGASREMPTLIDFQTSSIDLKEHLGLEDDSFSLFSGRKTLILGFTKELRRDVYVEKKISPPMNSWKNSEDRVINVYDCLTLFTTCEKLGADDAWYCPQCKKHQRATKKIDLWDLPKILIIHLKRFSYTRLLRDKIDSKVECPLVHLNMSQYLTKRDRPQSDYNLIGVVNHYGGMGGGHYTANCKNANLESWFNFDDNLVSPITSDRAVTSAAYVLFYMASDA